MKYELYKQMPGIIGVGGSDVLTLSPIPGYTNRIKAIYIDLPADVTLNVNLSTLSTLTMIYDDITSPGNEAGSIVFRVGVEYDKDVTITVTGAETTTYNVKVITELESVSIDVSSLLLAGAIGLVAGSIIARRKKERGT